MLKSIVLSFASAVSVGLFVLPSFAFAAGATWTDQTAAGSRQWQSITSSSDGTKLAAVEYGGDIWTSTDSGATWTDQTAAGSRGWGSITSSTDGTKLAAADSSPGDIWTSTDSGATWTDQTAAGSRYWWSITSSADGTKLAAVDATPGDIWTASFSVPAPTPTPTPAPTTHHSGGSAVICFGGLVWTPSKLACAPPSQVSTAPTTTPATIPTATSTPSGISFLTNHKLGDRGEDIRMLQQFLNTHGFILATNGAGSPGNETTLFGALTKAALIKFQRANNIRPAVGYFGPLTRAFIARVLGSTAAIATP